MNDRCTVVPLTRTNALFAVLPALYQHNTLFAGLEAAAALFMLGLFILIICLFARNPALAPSPTGPCRMPMPRVARDAVTVHHRRIWATSQARPERRLRDQSSGSFLYGIRLAVRRLAQGHLKVP